MGKWQDEILKRLLSAPDSYGGSDVGPGKAEDDTPDSSTTPD